ncbi:MAG TPA: histone deacetylase [Longimicrobiales bacterium]|nr:histone deacetylase [Longimicrobiales bacterium]
MTPPKVVWSPAYEVDLGAHVFPTQKYRLVRELLLAGSTVGPQDFVEPEAVSAEQLARAHTPEYLRKIREDGFSPAERFLLEVPFTREVERASLICCGGTVLAGRLALRDGVAVHLGGGFHHAFADHGEGFCLLNDVAVAAKALLEEGLVERVLVVDLDVHQGNGTADIFRGDGRVFTFSMHQQNNYPLDKAASDLDVGLPDGTGDASYLALLEANLARVVELHRPELAFYLAGADPFREDQLGGLALTPEGLRARDAYVLASLREAGCAVAVTLAGGYALHVADTTSIHAATVEEAFRTANRSG